MGEGMGRWAKRWEDRQSGGRTGKVAGGWEKWQEDGQSGLRMGEDVGQGIGGWAKGRGMGNEMDGMGQAPGLLGGVLGHGQRVVGRAFLRGPGLWPDVPGM